MARAARVRVSEAARPVGALMVTVSGPGPVPITLHVNGQTHTVSVEPRWSLLDVLRTQLGLTGAKRVCNLGECGACTVLLDGRPVYACLALAIETQHHEVLTVEGLSRDGRLDPVQESFIQCDAIQCGFCTPGQVLAVKALLAANPHPSDVDVRKALAGTLCRCGTYAHIRDAIHALSDGNTSDADEPTTIPRASRSSAVSSKQSHGKRR